MLTVSFSQLEAWLTLFIWPFLRIAGLVATAPIFSHRSLPRQVKVGFCIALTIIVSPTLPAVPDVPMLSWAGFGIVVEQLLIGVAIGTVMQVVFAIVQAAGDFIGLQMGLAFASFFSADSSSNTMILARLLYILSLMLFLAVDGHLLLVEILAESFRLIPIASFSLNAQGFFAIASFAGLVFKLGLLLALPVLGILLIINLSMGILNRAAPQFTVFSVGFPISLTVGMLLLVVLMTRLQGAVTKLFEQGFDFLIRLLEQGFV
jgi:flagellar biosynthetic protein FliR